MAVRSILVNKPLVKMMARLPGFAEEWDSSLYLRECVFGWFIHAFSLRPYKFFMVSFPPRRAY